MEQLNYGQMQDDCGEDEQDYSWVIPDLSNEELNQPRCLQDLKSGVQRVTLVPFQPDVAWLNQWNSKPVRFVQSCLPLALWSALGITCRSEPMRYPAGAQKVAERVRQRFSCPNKSAHPKRFCKERAGSESDMDDTWTSGTATFWIDYEIKWKSKKHQEVLVRFSPKLFREKCHRCRGDFLEGAVQNKGLVGIIERFVNGVAKRLKKQIQLQPEKAIEVVFGAGNRLPSSGRRMYAQQEIPCDHYFTHSSENPLSPGNEARRSQEDYNEQPQHREEEDLQLHMNWWDTSHMSRLFRKNSQQQQVRRLKNADNKKEPQNTTHDESRCEACLDKKCVISHRIADNIETCIIDEDQEQEPGTASQQKKKMSQLVRENRKYVPPIQSLTAKQTPFSKKTKTQCQIPTVAAQQKLPHLSNQEDIKKRATEIRDRLKKQQEAKLEERKRLSESRKQAKANNNDTVWKKRQAALLAVAQVEPQPNEDNGQAEQKGQKPPAVAEPTEPVVCADIHSAQAVPFETQVSEISPEEEEQHTFDESGVEMHLLEQGLGDLQEEDSGQLRDDESDYQYEQPEQKPTSLESSVEVIKT